METTTLKKTSVSAQLSDIRLDITWSKIARRYFDKSASWLYNKMNGIDGNGGEGDFTYSEKMQLKNALYDFSERIRKVADNII
ncbi:MAG: DUF5053 domain-containing protein [Candidatus Azobacteroides sp.]|jgi:hypothetical protein|nr:DUF5053 domain-containing protein [Candidatus Azobacteroides sp.]